MFDRLSGVFEYSKHGFSYKKRKINLGPYKESQSQLSERRIAENAKNRSLEWSKQRKRKQDQAKREKRARLRMQARLDTISNGTPIIELRRKSG